MTNQLTVSTFKSKNTERLIRSTTDKSQTLLQCMTLSDALFQKKSTLSHRISSKQFNTAPDLFLLQKQIKIEKNHLSDLINSNKILKEKKMLLNCMKLVDEMKKGYFHTVDTYMNGVMDGHVDESVTLAYSLLYFVGPQNHKNKSHRNDTKQADYDSETNGKVIDETRWHRIATYRENLISTLTSLLTRAIKESNSHILKGSILTLKVLGREKDVINTFIQNNSIFSADLEDIHFDSSDTRSNQERLINLDFFDCSGPFYQFIAEIKSAYSENIHTLPRIYEILNPIHSHLLDLINKVLLKYLQSCDKIERVFALYHSHLHIKTLKDFIKDLDKNIVFNVKLPYELDQIGEMERQMINDIVQCKFKSNYKVMNCNLREIFSQDSSDVVNRENANKNKDLMDLKSKKVKILILLFDTFNFRNDLFKYESTDYFRLKKKYINVIEQIILSNISLSSLTTFDNLTQYHFILKRISLDSGNIKKQLKKIFENYKYDREKEIRAIIHQDKHKSYTSKSNSNENENSLIKNLESMCKTEYKRIKKHIKGGNGHYLFRSILSTMNAHLTKHILKMSLTISQAKQVKSDLKFLRKTLKKMKKTETPFNFTYEMVKLICVEKDRLKILIGYKENKEEIKKWLKVRQDYQEIRSLIEF